MDLKQDLENQRENQEITIAKLAVIGSTLSTIGDAISTIAAILALVQVERENSDQQTMNNQTVDQQHIEKMQLEIDELKNELLQMKKKQ